MKKFIELTEFAKKAEQKILVNTAWIIKITPYEGKEVGACRIYLDPKESTDCAHITVLEPYEEVKQLIQMAL